MSMGYRSVVATTTGETSMKNEWITELQKFESIFIVFDSDQVGRESAEKVARKIGINIAKVVKLPEETKDANEFLKRFRKESKAEFDRLLKSARAVEVPTIHHIVDLVERVRGGFFGSNEPIEPYTPWDNVNEQLARLNGLVVLSAPQNVGKTTFGLNICDFWAERGKPSLFYCLEMTEEELTAKVIMARYMVTLEELKANTDNVFERFVHDYVERPFFIGYAPLAKKVSEVMEVLGEAIDRHNLQIVFFDNVHVMARSRDARHIIGELSAELKSLAMQTGATVVAIAQPRKIETGRIMDRWDVKESVDLLSDADNMIILHRQQIAAMKDTKVFEEETDAVLSPYTLVRIEKTRFGRSKDCILFLDGEHHRFRELYDGEEVEYRGKRGTWKTTDRSPEPAPSPAPTEAYNPSIDW
jgi:KaiC/GvpD/RAD55 family RecA-like ATPase